MRKHLARVFFLDRIVQFANDRSSKLPKRQRWNPQKTIDLFCVCRMPMDENDLCFDCDECKDSFHEHCVDQNDPLRSIGRCSMCLYGIERLIPPLVNMGNTCYMNVAFQLQLCTNPLAADYRNRYESILHLYDTTEDSLDGRALIDHSFGSFACDSSDENLQALIATIVSTNAWNRSTVDERGNHRWLACDAAEFFGVLISFLDQCIVIESFKSTLIRRTKCLNDDYKVNEDCKEEENTINETYLYYCLPIWKEERLASLPGNSAVRSKMKSLKECIEYELNEVIVDKRCRCGCTKSLRTSTIEQSPSNLILMLNRFEVNDATFYDHLIHFPLQSFLFGIDRYNVYCIVNFIPPKTDVEVGHFNAYVRKCGRWYLVDDDSVTEMSSTNLITSNAYIICLNKSNDLEDMMQPLMQ